jgi:hypothetical protein
MLVSFKFELNMSVAFLGSATGVPLIWWQAVVTGSTTLIVIAVLIGTRDSADVLASVRERLVLGPASQGDADENPGPLNQ